MMFPATGLAEPKMHRTAPEKRGLAISGFARVTLALSAALLVTPAALAQPLDDGDGTLIDCQEPYDPETPTRAYFGDTHVHTTYSIDAYTQGTDTTPDQAYRFAKGELTYFHPFAGGQGRPGQIGRPLDFAVVTDHAEFFGEYNACFDPTHSAYSETNCEQLRDERNSDTLVTWNVLLGTEQANVKRFSWCTPSGGSEPSLCTDKFGDTWQVMKDAAAAHYTGALTKDDPVTDCDFTTFIGYEWTGAPTGAFGNGGLETLNLHRNVVFRNSIVPDRPATYLDDGYPENLWNSLEDECLNLDDPNGDCDVFTIPHNSNLSQGRIFELIKPDGAPYNPGKLKQRQDFEPLIEIIQHKGQSECLATSADELCAFEDILWGHLAVPFLDNPTVPLVEGTVRHALKEGMVAGPYNPFQYGLIGSTDTHLGAPGHVEEDANYLGHGGATGGESGTVFTGITDAPEANPGGLAVVWASQNSRAALFDAMKRREVYGTSGPRHIVRFFGGWDLGTACGSSSMVSTAYANGVPMGSVLPKAGAGQTAPQFLVSAAQDPLGSALQRIQIIKGYVDPNGDTQEEVYEVAGDPGNGAGVDPADCTPTGGAGASELCAVWTDPNFDADQKAFYYARVVENPSCRWTQRQCLVAAALPAPDTLDCDAEPPVIPTGYDACCDTNVPKTVQERSWASPVWYNPPPPGC